MTVKLWRRENLLTLLGEYSRREFCDRAGLATTYLSQFIAREQDIDDTTARQIEAGLKLPRGWMDVSHATQSSQTPVKPVGASAENLPVGASAENLPVEERVLVAKFRQLDPADQVHVRAVIDAFLAARRAHSS